MRWTLSVINNANPRGKTVAQVVEAELKKHSPFESYAKSLTKEMLDSLLANMDRAIKRAENALNDSAGTGEKNPSTEVHLLVKALYDLRSK